MVPRFSEVLIKDLIASLETALVRNGIVNIPHLAEEIRQRNAMENVALEDIAHELMQRAQIRNAAMEFDAGVLTSFG
jgi:hypothetical protein